MSLESSRVWGLNTPTHLVVNLLALDRRPGSGVTAAITAGALLPDLPMLVFYAWHKLIGTAERVIWSVSYYEPAWQDAIDVFNSLPLIGLFWLVAWRLRARTACWLLASMVLHVACDLPFHYDDAHRHFFPLSDWRFESPVSYWDPQRYGRIFAPLEAVTALAGCAVLARRYQSRSARAALASLAAVYALFIAYAFVMWV